jgi:hypothetical protein
MYGSHLDAFGEMDLVLTGAKPFAPSGLIVSTGVGLLPFKGGVLVPDLSLCAIISLVPDNSGVVAIPGITGGFGPVTIILQCVIQDASAPLGYCLSNALSVDFLP